MLEHMEVYVHVTVIAIAMLLLEKGAYWNVLKNMDIFGLNVIAIHQENR